MFQNDSTDVANFQRSAVAGHDHLVQPREFGRAKFRICRNQRLCVLPGGLQYFMVAQQVSDSQWRHSMLLPTKQIAGPAHLKVKFGKLETILTFDKSLQPFERMFVFR